MNRCSGYAAICNKWADRIIHSNHKGHTHTHREIGREGGRVTHTHSLALINLQQKAVGKYWKSDLYTGPIKRAERCRQRLLLFFILQPQQGLKWTVQYKRQQQQHRCLLLWQCGKQKQATTMATTMLTRWYWQLFNHLINSIKIKCGRASTRTTAGTRQADGRTQAEWAKQQQ